MKVLTVEGRVRQCKTTHQLTATACQHGLDILKFESVSSSIFKTSLASDLFVHSKALPLHLINIFPFFDFDTIKPTRLRQEDQGGHYVGSAQQNHCKDQTTGCPPRPRNPYETRPIATQDPWHAQTR